MKSVFLVCLAVALASAQDYDYEQQQYQQRPAPSRLQPGNGPVETKPAPIAILKQINRHNEDGSYTYGYEGADGSFKIETKAQTGEVKGKYGYVDESGKVRVVEYGADKYGFQPSGDGITVPPPTLVDESRLRQEVDYEDEPQQQQRQQKPYIARVANPRPSRPVQPRPQQYEEYEQPQYQVQQPQPQPQPRRQQFASGPAPPRAVIAGAAPVESDVSYSSHQRPPRPDPEYSQQSSFGSAQQHQEYQPNPVPRQQEQPFSVQHQQIQYSAPRAVEPATYSRPKAASGRSTSVLDQLAKDYALPANGAAPLHDISFGYY